jgi:hypothetical protein
LYGAWGDHEAKKADGKEEDGFHHRLPLTCQQHFVTLLMGFLCFQKPECSRSSNQSRKDRAETHDRISFLDRPSLTAQLKQIRRGH